MPFKEPALALRDIAEAIDAIKRFTRDMDAAAFRADAKTVAAVERKLQVISEAAGLIANPIKHTERRTSLFVKKEHEVARLISMRRRDILYNFCTTERLLWPFSAVLKKLSRIEQWIASRSLNAATFGAICWC